MARIDLALQAQFESKYSHALYENSTRLVNLQKDKVIPLDIFRQLMGVPDKRFLNTSELTRNVINSAVEEVNQRADFMVELSPIKSGKKIVAFEWAVKSKSSSTQTVQMFPEEEVPLYTRIKNDFEQVSEQRLMMILRDFEQSYVQEKMAYTKKYAKQNAAGRYPFAYLISALKDDYQDHKQAQVAVDSAVKVSSDVERQWRNKLREINTEIKHWENLLAISPAKSKASMQNLLNKTQDKLKQHCSSQSAKDIEVS